MTVKKIIKDWLDITKLEGEADDLNQRISQLEDSAATQLKHFGNYKNRTKEELSLMKKQIDDILSSIELFIEREENTQLLERAKALIRRIKNNKTRISKMMNI